MRTRVSALAAISAAVICAAIPSMANAAPSWVTPAWTLGASSGVLQPEEATAVSPSGDAIVVWIRGGIEVELVSRRRSAGGEWGPERVVVSGAAFGDRPFAPRVAMDAGGNATVIWCQDSGGQEQLYTATLAAGTDSWSAPRAFEHAMPRVFDGQLSVAPDGTRIVTWMELTPGTSEHLLRADFDPGSGWTGATSFAGGDGYWVGEHRAVAEPGGQATIAWVRIDDTFAVYELFVARRAGGAWSTDELVGPGRRLHQPRVAGDGADGTVVSWYETDGDDDETASLRAAFREAGGWTLTTVSGEFSSNFCDRRTALSAGPDGRATIASWGGDIGGIVASAGDRTGWSAPSTIWAPLEDQGLFDAELTQRTATPTLTWLMSGLSEGAATLALGAARRTSTGWEQAGEAGHTETDELVFSLATAGDRHGNALVAYAPLNYPDDTVTMKAIGLQATGPAIDGLFVPSRADAGEEISFGVDASSVFARVSTPTWNFGDGSPIVSGRAVEHRYAADGNYTVTVSVADSVGNVTTRTRQVRVGGGGPTPKPVLNPPFVRHRGGVLRVGAGERTVRVRIVNRDRARLRGAVRLGRFVRRGGKATIRTLALRRGVRLPSRGQRTVSFRLSAETMRALRAAPRRSIPVRVILRMRAPDGRFVRSVATFTLDGRDAFRRKAAERGATPSKPGAPLARKSAC